MGDTMFGIDKGIIKAFALMIVVVSSVTVFFLSEYVATVVLGSVGYVASNESGGSVPVSLGTDTLLQRMGVDFVTTFGFMNAGFKTAAGLIVVGAVILIFQVFLPKNRKKNNQDY